MGGGLRHVSGELVLASRVGGSGTRTVCVMPRELTYRSTLTVVSGLLLATSRRRYQGLEHIPAHGPAIVVCNHIANSDPAVLANFVHRAGRLPRAMAKHTLFSVPVFGTLLRKMRHIPVARKTDKASDSLMHAQDALVAGEVVMLWPEGTISTGDQWLLPAKTGAARMAMRTGAPVVPVAQWGAQRLLPSSWKWLMFLAPVLALFWRPRVHALAGEPIYLKGDPDNLEDLRAETARMMAQVEAQLIELRGPKPVPAAAA